MTEPEVEVKRLNILFENSKSTCMKRSLILYVAFLFAACHTSSDQKSEEAAITKLLNNESQFAAKGDSIQWKNCWVNSDDASFIFTSAAGVEVYDDFQSLAQAIGQTKPFELKLERDNYRYTIGDDVAFVSFDQQDNWEGVNRKTKETRTLRKVNDEWKILHSSVVVISSFTSQVTASYHAPVDKIPKNPRNGFHNISGLGGMSIGYMEVPGPTDFTPLFKGLPGDMCSCPHWGYVIDGALRIKYPGGKEETVNAGEVFYWPAPHTGIVDKNVKFIDFSPDDRYIPVMDHLAKKIAEATSE